MVYVTYRVPVEVELEIETGEIINVHIMDEKLEGPLGVFNDELMPMRGPGAARLGPGLVLLRSFLQTNRANLNGSTRTHKTSSDALRPNHRRSQNPCYTLKRNCRHGVVHGL